MSIVNKKVTAPISLWEVARLVRSTLLDLYTVCRSPYINKWSKVKPVLNYSKEEIYDFGGTYAKGYRYAIKMKTQDGHNMYKQLDYIHEINWEYQRPNEETYSRLTDFDGYNHIATHNPLVSYKLPTFYNNGRIELKIDFIDTVYGSANEVGINTLEEYESSMKTDNGVNTFLADNTYPYVLIGKELRAMKSVKNNGNYSKVSRTNNEFYVDLSEGAFTESSTPLKVSFFLVNKVPPRVNLPNTGSTTQEGLVHKSRDSWENMDNYFYDERVGNLNVRKFRFGCLDGYTIIPLADATGLSKTFVDFDNCSVEAEYSFVTDGTNHYLRIDKVKFNGVEEESVVASVSISNKFKSAVVWNMPVQLVTDYEISTPKLYKLSGRSALDTEKEYMIKATYNGVVEDNVIMTFNGFGDYNWDFNDDFWKQQFEAGEIADFNEDFNKDFKV